MAGLRRHSQRPAVEAEPSIEEITRETIEALQVRCTLVVNLKISDRTIRMIIVGMAIPPSSSLWRAPGELVHAPVDAEEVHQPIEPGRGAATAKQAPAARSAA